MTFCEQLATVRCKNHPDCNNCEWSIISHTAAENLAIANGWERRDDGMICFECIAKEATGYLSGHETGYAAGYNRGYAEGHDSGYTLGLRNNSDTRRIAKACKAAYKHGLEQCAAGPWQPMSTAPELEDVLIKVKYGDEIKVMIACRYENHWMHNYDPDRMQDDGKIVAWAAINPQEGGE